MIQKLLDKLGYRVYNVKKEAERFPGDFEQRHIAIYKKVAPYTMTSRERIFSAIEAAAFISKHKIEGDIVECGVWKGGSTMAMLETLKQAGDTTRNVYLYDTFEGMPPPTEDDKTTYNKSAEELLNADADKEKNLVWAYSSIEEVKSNIALSGYNPNLLHFVKGKVEDTIPATLPGKIALLRLDTDWYESTKHELEYLYPLLVKGGVLIIDDYGHWQGAKKAVDEYIESNKIPILLNRIDDTGRIAVKP
ncbi:TylF/MycF family methyltransferase [soil metagenome]